MEIIAKKFSKLTPSELYGILQLRAKVFVVEQNCVYNDLDGVDEEAYHVFAVDGGQIVGCLRVIDKGKRLSEVSLGRIVSASRLKGVGSMLVKKGEEIAREVFGATRIMVGAQVQARAFYEKQGFVKTSDVYLEDGIPHIYMTKKL